MLVKIFWLRKQPRGSLSTPCCPSMFGEDLECALCSKALQEPFTCTYKAEGIIHSWFPEEIQQHSLGLFPTSPSPREAGVGPCGAAAQSCTGQALRPLETAHLGFVPKELFVLSCCTTAAAEQSCPCEGRIHQGRISCLHPWKQEELNWDFFYMDTTDIC